MMLSGHDRLKRLRWQSRRGMKELDVLLEAFLEKQARQLCVGAWPELEELLLLEDDVLFDWISGRDLPSNPAILKLLDSLKNAD